MPSRRSELGRLYAETGHLVLRRCLQILQNSEEAMDAVQWTFMRAIETSFELRSRGEAMVWLYRTASRRCLWMMRNTSHRSRIVDRHRDELAGRPIPATEESLMRRELVARALEGMGDDAAQVVLMTYIWGYTNQRAAQLAGISVRTVGRARATFEARLRALAAPEEAQG